MAPGQSRPDRHGGGERGAGAGRQTPSSGVYLVPAFQGLGAPFWDAGAQGGGARLTLAASKADIVAAGLEAVAFQTRDLLTAMRRDMAVSGIPLPPVLARRWRHDRQRWLMQRLADILGQSVEVALYPETTALGAAYHAGQAVGFYGSAEELEELWRPGAAFEPKMSEAEREARYGGWLDAVARVRSKAQAEGFCRKSAQASLTKRHSTVLALS